MIKPIKRFKMNNAAYFDMGSEWGRIQSEFGYSNRQMFDNYNVPFLDDQIARGHSFYFTVDPTTVGNECGTYWEYQYLSTQYSIPTECTYNGQTFWVMTPK